MKMSENDLFHVFKLFSIFVLLSTVISIFNKMFLGGGLIKFADNYSSIFSVGSEFGQTVTTEDLINAAYTPYIQIRNLNGSYLSLGNTLFFANMFFLASYYFKKKKQDLILFLIGSLFIILTGARAATVISLLISLFILTFYYRKPTVSIGLLIGLFVLFFNIPGLSEKFSDAFDEIMNLESRTGHIGGWNNFLDAFVQNPFGYGFGVGERSAATFGTTQLIGGESNISHILGNMGIIGCALWSAMIMYSWTRSFHLLRHTTLSDMAILSFTTFFVSIGFFLIAFTQYLNDNYEASLPLWLLVGWVSFHSYQPINVVEKN